MTEIESLATQVGDLGQSVDRWNVVMLWGLALAALAAVVIGISTRLVVIRSGQQSEAQESLIRAKDRQLALDLGDKDVKIAEANARATKAQESLGLAEEHSAEANERAAKLESEAATAKLETEKLKQVVAWRIIPPESAVELERVLSRKPGSVNLRYTDGDPEALFLAIQISQILEKAKWQVAPGSEKFANAIQFGIALPDSTGADATALRDAFVAAKISFSRGPLPPRGGQFLRFNYSRCAYPNDWIKIPSAPSVGAHRD